MSQEQDIFKPIGRRLEEIRKTLNYSRSEFAGIMDLSEAYYGQMARGARKTTVMALFHLLKKEPGFNAVWIITGKGEMLLADMSNDLDRKLVRLTTERDLLLKILNVNNKKKK